MATHHETRLRKNALMEELRAAYQGGQQWDGEALSQRALSQQYGLSGRTVAVLLQELIQEGVLYTVPRVGTFMGRPAASTLEPFLFLSQTRRTSHMYVEQILSGFEDRIAQLGGVSLALSINDVLGQSDFPALSGVFHFNTLNYPLDDVIQPNIPRVVFDDPGTGSNADWLNFDDEEGGIQAVRQLLDKSHRKIAYLGLHGARDEAGAFGFSARRECGWRRMMQDAGQNTEGLLFLPEFTSPFVIDAQIECAREVAAKLVLSSEITAVVVVNVWAAYGLIEALQTASVASERWPSILCFDNAPEGVGAVVSYLRLPWEKMGAEAAQLLWERRTGRLTGPQQRRLVKMHLIPRLTCHPNWAYPQAVRMWTLNNGVEQPSVPQILLPTHL